MNFKKTIAKSLVVAMALGMVPVANLQTAKAADPVITFKGAEGTATVAGAKFWGIAKEDKKGGKDSVTIGADKYKITNVQDISDMIDVYAALKGKAGIIAVGDTPVPDGTWKVLKLEAADTTFKVQFVASTGAVKGTKPAHALGGDFGYLFATKGKKGETEVNLKTDAEKVEVKLNDGSWQTFQAFLGGTAPTDELVNKRLRSLGQSGSSLSFRIKGTDTAWASKESKLKIATQGNAPAAKVDVTKETTSVKNGVEWQLVDEGNAADATKWKLSTSKKGLTFSELTGLDVTKNQDLLVRTGANAKKIASKVGRVTLKKPEGALTVGAGGKITGTGAAINVGSKVGVIVSATLAYDITKGALIQNVSDKDIEYALVPSTGDTSKFKWSVLKASKDPVKKPTKANLKHSTDEKANTWTEGKTKLFLRLSGTKQDKNGVATRSGVSAGAILAIEKIAQAFTFESGTVAGDATKAEIAASATTAAIKVATGTAATFTINAKIDKVVNPKGGSPKVKVVKALPKGVTYKVGKVDGATGKFTITVNVSNKAFVTADPSGEAEFGLTYEGVNSGFKVTFAKKN